MHGQRSQDNGIAWRISRTLRDFPRFIGLSKTLIMAASYERFSDESQLPYTDKEPVRPRTYYGEGTFDAESSVSSEEGDALLMDKPGPVDLADSELGKPTVSPGQVRRQVAHCLTTH